MPNQKSALTNTAHVGLLCVVRLALGGAAQTPRIDGIVGTAGTEGGASCNTGNTLMSIKINKILLSLQLL
jgi:hypothetical protein